MRKPYFTGLLLAVALCAMAAKANAADQPPPNMVGGIEQAMVTAKVQNVQFSVNVVLSDGVQTLANEASAMTVKISGEDIQRVAQGDKADIFNDSAARLNVQRYAESATAKTNSAQVAGKFDPQQDLNQAPAIDSADKSHNQAQDTDVGWRASQLQFRANVLENSGQTSDEVTAAVRNAADQPAQHLAMKQRPPTNKVYGLLESSQSPSIYT